MSRRFAPLLVAALALAGCAAPSVETSLLMPARQDGMTGAKRIGVAPLGGDYGGRYTARLQAHLAGITVKGAPHFTLVEIDRKAILNEQKAGDSAQFDEATAVRLGRLVAADTIISGAVTPPRHRVQRSRQERRKCVEGSWNDKTRRYDKCTKYETYQVRCTKQTSSFALNLRATSVERGTVSYIRDYRGASEDFTCEDRRPGKSVDSLNEAAVRQVLQDIRYDVAPYPQTFSISFLDYDAKGSLGRKSYNFKGNKAVEKLVKQGLEDAEDKRTDTACALFREAAGRYDGSPAIYHNLGVCAEFGGDFDQALAFYETADRLSGGRLDPVRDSLARVKANRASARKAEQQLR